MLFSFSNSSTKRGGFVDRLVSRRFNLEYFADFRNKIEERRAVRVHCEIKLGGSRVIYTARLKSNQRHYYFLSESYRLYGSADKNLQRLYTLYQIHLRTEQLMGCCPVESELDKISDTELANMLETAKNLKWLWQTKPMQ